MPGVDSDIQRAYQETASARDFAINSGNGIKNWNDAWTNFMANYALSEAEFRNNKDMWNLMNEYNSPSAQMQRFKEAGLNPNLIYTQGTPGNASSPVTYSAPQVSFKPQQEKQDRILQRLNGIMQIVGAVNNLTQNIGQMYDTSLNIGLKRNQLFQSDLETKLSKMYHPAAPGDRVNFFGGSLEESLNPMSTQFDAGMYLYYAKHGALPQFVNTFLTSDRQRELIKLRSDYQDYYNKNILPKFSEYQQGKIDLQTFEKSLYGYEQEAREMTPAWLKGVLDPLFGYLGPLIREALKYLGRER